MPTDSQTEFTDSQIDSTYDELLGDSPPVDREELTQETQTPQETQPKEQPMIKFNHKGKEVMVPYGDPKVIQWIQQGYDYNNNTEAFKRQQAEFQTQQAQIQELQKQYGPVDEWVKSNPDMWQKFVKEIYEPHTQGQVIDQNNPLAQTVQALQQELAQLKQPVTEILSERQRAQIESQDKALDAEIESVKQQFGLDLKAPEADGRSKELKVYEHAQKIGTKSFRAAFLDLYHADLIKSAEDRGKESLNKERQKQTKLGLLGKSSTPSKGLSAAKDYKNKSNDELIREGLEELGLAVDY